MDIAFQRKKCNQTIKKIVGCPFILPGSFFCLSLKMYPVFVWETYMELESHSDKLIFTVIECADSFWEKWVNMRPVWKYWLFLMVDSTMFHKECMVVAQLITVCSITHLYNTSAAWVFMQGTYHHLTVFNFFRFCCCSHTASVIREVWRSSWQLCVPGHRPNSA